MLKDSELGRDLWAEAISTHIYIWNRCPSSILPNGITPYERVFSHAPSIGHLRVFGSKCFIKVPDETRTKLDDKAKECHLLGNEGDSIYVVVDVDKRNSGHITLSLWKELLTAESKMLPPLLSSQNMNRHASKK